MWKKLLNILTRTTPIEKEKDILLDHDYDGIQELDNKLPPWWLWMLYITIIIAAIYFYRYHISGDWSSGQEWEMEMTAAKEKVDAYMATQGDIIDENSVTLLESAEGLENGKVIWDTNCAACHKVDGGGLIGPNMTDEFWVHGGDIKDLFRTIKYGVPEKGMISWKSQLNPTQMQEVASYVLLKLAGTNPPDAKAAEGDKYEAEAEAEAELPIDSTATEANTESTE